MVKLVDVVSLIEICDKCGNEIKRRKVYTGPYDEENKSIIIGTALLGESGKHICRECICEETTGHDFIPSGGFRYPGMTFGICRHCGKVEQIPLKDEGEEIER